MPSPIFPIEITEHSIEQHWAEHSTRSQAIYLTLVLAVVAALASLPFIYVDVSVPSSGLLRPIAEKTELKSPISGKVAQVLVSDNQYVERGELLLTVQTDLLDQQLTFRQQRLQELGQYISDLSYLLSTKELTKAPTPSLRSSLYQQAHYEFYQRVGEIQTRAAQTKKAYVRAVMLGEKQLIAFKEIEERKLALDMTQAELASLEAQQRNQWQIALRQHREEQAQLTTDVQRLNKEKEQYQLIAPENGTIQNFSGIYPGSHVVASQPLAELSPDSQLVVESYVSPTDIGFLKVDMPINVQVDAFNYNEWGTVAGKVISVSNDMVLLDSQPFFKVRSVLEEDHLSLASGYAGKLKKGMTVQVHFLLNHRSIYQLLYDKVDSWLNPMNER